MDYSNDTHKAMQQAQGMLLQQLSQAFSESTHEICFKRCLTSPGSSLDARQKACLQNCQALMGETFKLTVDTLNAALQG